MMVTVSGLTGSGKDTLGKLLAECLHYKIVSPTFKELAKEEGVSLLEFQKKAEKDHSIDKKFDELLKKQASKNCVVTTWLAPWILKADFRIYLFASLETRAKRISTRDRISLKEAKEHITRRDEGNRKRYLDVYGIDIFDYSSFDIGLNSGKYAPQQMMEIIMEFMKIAKKSR